MSRIKILDNQIQKNDTIKDKEIDPINSLTIKDNRTNQTLQIPVKNNYFKATHISKLNDCDGNVLRSYDPGFMNTISCTSKISFIDGDKGILEYRGIPIEILAEKSSFMEVSFLLIYGELPTKEQLDYWEYKIMTHTFIHTDIFNYIKAQMMKSFRFNAHPMGMLISTLAAISTFHPESNPALSGQNIYQDKKLRNKQVHRLLGTITTIAANSYRHRIGRSYNKPETGLHYVENFLYMLDRLNEHKFRAHPKLVKALDVLFILHAEHELNCSTAVVRHLASSGVDVYKFYKLATMAGGASALYGPKHGGANEQVVRMLEEIGNVNNIPNFINDVKEKKKLLFGFGHRIYKNYDPRAKIVKKIAYDVFGVIGKEPLIEIALELEKIALNDQYFVQRKLFPNVDFYSGVIYKAMGFPLDMFPVLFTIPRMAGWIAHWYEFLDDKENKIVRPRQNYVGYKTRDYVELKDRQDNNNLFLESVPVSIYSRRSQVAYSKNQISLQEEIQKSKL